LLVKAFIENDTGICNVIFRKVSARKEVDWEPPKHQYC
jgi:hypothetical protein